MTMSEEVRVETRVTDLDDLSYHIAEIERDIASLLDDGLIVTVVVKAILPRE